VALDKKKGDSKDTMKSTPIILLMETDKLHKLTATAMQGLLFLSACSQLFCITIMYVVANFMVFWLYDD
jgi:hypothetical protein